MMKALRFHGQNDIRLEDVEIPRCGKDQVKVGRGVDALNLEYPANLCIGQTRVRGYLWHRSVTSKQVLNVMAEDTYRPP